MTTESKDELKALLTAIRALRRLVTAELKRFHVDIRESRQRYRQQRGNHDRLRFAQKCQLRAQYHRAGALLAAADRAVHGLMQAPVEPSLRNRWAMTVFQVMHRLTYTAFEARDAVLDCHRLPSRVVSGILELPYTEALVSSYMARQTNALKASAGVPEPQAVEQLLRENPQARVLTTAAREARKPAEALYMRIIKAMPDLTTPELALLSTSLLGVAAIL